MLEHPNAGDVFAGVGLAFEAQARDAFQKLQTGARVGVVRVIPSAGAAVNWDPGVAAVDVPRTRRIAYGITLHLPAVNPEDTMTRRDAALFAAYSAHELGHVLFTNLDVFGLYGRRGQMHKHIINGLEDPRMERTLIASRFIPGARSLLHPLAEFILEKSGADFRAACAADQLAAVPFALAILCREYPLPGLDAVRAILPARMREAVRIGLDAVRAAKCTGDLIPACDAILDLYTQPQAAPQPGGNGKGKPQPQPDAGDNPADGQPGGDAGDGDAGDDAGAESGEASGKGKPGGAGDADDKSADGETSPGSGDADADAGDGEGDGEGDDATGNAGDAGGGAGGRTPGEILDEAGAAIAADPSLDPEPARIADAVADKISGDRRVTFEGELYAAMQPVDWATHGDGGHGKESGAAFGAHALTVCKPNPISQTKMTRALRSPRVSWANRKLLAGRIDPARLPRTGVGDGSVFIRRGETPATETALTLLIDASGSMKGENSMLAAQAAYSLAHLFGTMALPVEIASFTTGGPTGCSIRVVKRRDEALQKAATRVAAMQTAAHGGTPDCEAVNAYARRMRHWQEARRILIVITDGVGSATETVMRDVLATAERNGIQVAGLGIGVNPGSLAARYPKRNVAVRSVREVPQALADLLLSAADEWDKARGKA